MAYSLSDPRIGAQVFGDTSVTAQHAPGTILKGIDPVYGEGEFIYLSGAASTVYGDVVAIDQRNGATATVRAAAGARGPVAVAMSANVAGQYGWYQIAGAAIVKSLTAAAAGNVYLTATAGTVDDAVVSGDRIDGARYKTADGTPSAGFAVVQIDRPSANANG